MEKVQQETRKQKYEQLRRKGKLSTVTKLSITISVVFGMLLFAFLPDSFTIQKPKLLKMEQVVAAESIKDKATENNIASNKGTMIISHNVTKGETTSSLKNNL